MKKIFLMSAVLMMILIFPAKTQAYLLDGVQQFNGHYYKVFNFGMTWDDAKIFCENLGGHLVTITSAQEQNFIENILSNNANKNFYWIGGHKNKNENWIWITGEPFNYSNWKKGEPNNSYGKENSLMIFKNTYSSGNSVEFGKWNDLAADGYYNPNDFYMTRKSGLICEWENSNSVKVRY